MYARTHIHTTKCYRTFVSGEHDMMSVIGHVKKRKVVMRRHYHALLQTRKTNTNLTGTLFDYRNHTEFYFIDVEKDNGWGSVL